MIRDVLFGSSVNPVGQMIRIGSQPFTVGLLAPKGESSNPARKAAGTDPIDALRFE